MADKEVHVVGGGGGAGMLLVALLLLALVVGLGLLLMRGGLRLGFEPGKRQHRSTKGTQAPRYR